MLPPRSPFAPTALAALSLSLALSDSASAQELPRLSTVAEGLDGKQLDVCGPSRVTTSPLNARVWMAQGRRRVAVRVQDRSRRFGEEVKTYESPLCALALDEDHARLFTLTSGTVAPVGPRGAFTELIPPVLRVEDVTTPPFPAPLGSLVLAGDAVSDVQVLDADARTLLLVCGQRLRVVSYSGDALVELTPPDGIRLPEVFAGTCPGAKFVRMESATIHRIDGRTLALIETVVANPDIQMKPQARGIVICDVTDPVAAAFLTGPGQSLDPIALAGCVVEGVNGKDWLVNDVLAVRDGDAHTLYVAGNEGIGLLHFDATNVLSSGIGAPLAALPGRYLALAADAQIDGWAGAEGEGPDRLYAIAQGAVLAIDRWTLDVAATKTDTGIVAPMLDVKLIEEDPSRRTLWAAFPSDVDYKWKIVDVSQPESGELAAPSDVEQRYAAGGVDGAVAMPQWDAVYALNWGGVVRWDLSGEEARPVISSYQPALDAEGASLVTEQLALHDLGAPGIAGATDRRLLAPTGTGGFVAWAVSEVAPHDPGPPQHFAPPDGYWPAHWEGDLAIYGNDLAVGVDPTNGHRIVLVDYADVNAVPEASLAVGRYDWDTGGWLPPILMPGGTPLHPLSKDLCVDDGFVFVTADNGFFVANLATGQVDDWVVTYTLTPGLSGPMCGRAVSVIEGVARWKDRVFVSSYDLEPDPDRDLFGVTCFEFHVDEDTGRADLGDAVACIFDEAGGASDPFPGDYLTGGRQIRAAEIADGVVRVYAATKNGVLVEFEYRRTGLGYTFEPTATWRDEHYPGELVDCPIYLDGIPKGGGKGTEKHEPSVRVLVIKWLESWALVEGSPVEE